MAASTPSAARLLAAAGGKPNEPFGRRFHHITGAETVSTIIPRHPASITSRLTGQYSCPWCTAMPPLDRLRRRAILRKSHVAQNLAAILVEMDDSRLFGARGARARRISSHWPGWQGKAKWLLKGPSRQEWRAPDR